MGFCSGTEIFDTVAKTVIAKNISEQDKIDILASCAYGLFQHDWDCEADSEYYDIELVTKALELANTMVYSPSEDDEEIEEEE